MITLGSLRAAKPVRLLVAFLAGGLLTCVVIGEAVVRGLRSSRLADTGNRPPNAAVYLGCGLLALAAAYALRRYAPALERRASVKRERREAQPVEGRMERVLEHGALLTFGAGIALNVVPGVVPIVALKDIAQIDVGVAGTTALLIVFYVLMFSFVEAPLAGYLVAPSWTRSSVASFNRWLDINIWRLARSALAIAGVVLLVRALALVLAS